MSKRTAILVVAMLAVLLGAMPAFAELERQMVVKSWERLQTLTDGSRLAHPIGISHDRYGNIIAADTGNGRVVKLSREGELLLAFGSPGSGPGELHLPADVAVDNDGYFYVADVPDFGYSLNTTQSDLEMTYFYYRGKPIGDDIE